MNIKNWNKWIKMLYYQISLHHYCNYILVSLFYYINYHIYLICILQVLIFFSFSFFKIIELYLCSYIMYKVLTAK